MGHDAIVIGGGLSGASLAIQLASAGRDVVLLEKAGLPHDKVCGEFLSKEALHYLARMDVDLAELGAVPIDHVRVAAREIIAETALPFVAMSLRRRDLDECLLAKAEAAGAVVRRGERVQTVEERSSRWSARLSSGVAVEAAAVFLSNGKHDLQGHARTGGKQNDLVAFKMYFRLEEGQQRALARTIELTLFPGGYAGLQPVNGGIANLCLLVTRVQLQRCQSNWARLLEHMLKSSAHLEERLAGAEALLDRPLAISAIPYGFLNSSARAGLWQVGDQAAVIPSFSGDGMSIALHSAHAAAEMFLRGEDSQSFATRFAAELRPGIRFATTISRMLVGYPSVVGLARWRPSVLKKIVTATRIPESSLLR